MNKLAITGMLVAIILTAATFVPTVTLVQADDDDDDDDEGGNEEIIEKLNQISNDLKHKKSFYEAKDETKFEDTSATIFAVEIALTACDSAIPPEKRAFNLEGLGLATSGFGSITVPHGAGVEVDGKFVTHFPLLSRIVLVKHDSTNLLIETGLIQLAASGKITFNALALPDEGGITLEVVAVGEMPQGCEVLVETQTR